MARALTRTIALLAAAAGLASCDSGASEDSALTFVEVQIAGVGGVEGLIGANSVILTPNGQNLYATGIADDSLVVFKRNSETGALTFLEVHMEDVSGVDGLEDPTVSMISPDGRHLYLASVIDIDGDGLRNATSMAMSPDGKHLYAGSSGSRTIAVFSRNTTTGALTLVEVRRNCADKAERYPQVSITSCDTGEALGIDAASLAMSPNGKHLYVVSALASAVAVFNRNATTGALTFQSDSRGGADRLIGSNSIAMSPDGRHVYAASVLTNTVMVFNRDLTTGLLMFVESKTEGVGGFDGLFRVDAVAVSPGGERVYATSNVEHSLVVFSRDVITGALTLVEVQRDGKAGVDGLDGASGVTVSLDGRHLYVAGSLDFAVAVFSVSDESSAVVNSSIDD